MMSVLSLISSVGKRQPSITYSAAGDELTDLYVKIDVYRQSSAKKSICSTEYSTTNTDTKPLPTLPRNWSRVSNEISIFLRGLGLGIVVTTFHGLFNRDFSEPEKVVIRKSRLTALLRMFIHIVPMGVALAEIILNMKGHYLGSEFNKQSYVQFAAKAHELTMQASLATIVLSLIRYEVTSREGLPFGAFLGSLQFYQISYLWSIELWSSIFAPDYRLARKLRLLLVIIPCAIIAAVAGPSSANLLIPQKTLWPVNPASRLSINATFQDIWPDQLDGTNVPENCTVLQGSPADALCPSYDWASIQAALEFFQGSILGSFEDASHHQELYLSLDNDNTGFSKITQSLLCTSSAADQFCASSPQEAVLYGLNDAFTTWLQGIFNTTSFNDAYAQIRSEYYEPYAIVSCLADNITDSNKQDPVRFARISETNQELAKPRTINELPNLTKGQLLDSSRNVSEYQLTWTALPTPLFNDKAFGAIILLPSTSQTQTPTSDLPQEIMTCTLKAGWGTSTVRTDALDQGIFYSTITGIPSSWPTFTFNSGEVEDESDPNFANYSGFQYPQRLIDISPDWAAFLNPLVPTGDGGNTSAINAYISTSSTEAYNEVGMAKLLGIMLTSGLGRNGASSSWQGEPRRVHSFHHV